LRGTYVTGVANPREQRDLYIGLTDRDWFEFLSRCSGLDEVNFWRPGGSLLIPRPGAPFLFKLKAPVNAIVGVGFFERSVRYSIRDAWEFFGKKNGVENVDRLIERISQYVGRPIDDRHEIGCVFLDQPTFFERSAWIDPPRDWKSQIQAGTYYDMNAGEGARVWEQVRARLGAALPPPALSADSRAAFGGRAKTALYLPRQGQGTFRAIVLDAYDRRCAISGERTVPVLDAAHIVPFSERLRHELSNGIALRSDIHRLFDKGYVSIRPDRRFVVSPRLREDFSNGKIYYEMNEREVRAPSAANALPDVQNLERHYEEIFKR